MSRTIANSAAKQAGKQGRRRSWRRFAAYLAASCAVVVLVISAVAFVLGDAILSHYGKLKAERAFADGYPGSTLRIGKLDYAIGANRLIAQKVVLSATNTTLEVDRITLTDVSWARLLWGKAALADVLHQAPSKQHTSTRHSPTHTTGTAAHGCVRPFRIPS